MPEADLEFNNDLRGQHVKYRVTVSSPEDSTLTASVRRRFSEFLHLHALLNTTLEVLPDY